MMARMAPAGVADERQLLMSEGEMNKRKPSQQPVKEVTQSIPKWARLPRG